MFRVLTDFLTRSFLILFELFSIITVRFKQAKNCEINLINPKIKTNTDFGLLNLTVKWDKFQ